MSALRSRVAAAFVADVHLSLTPPPARDEEPSWLDAQARQWRAVQEVAGGAPVVVAGDLFDRWDAPAELVNWALETLPPLLAVPGNHELPYHRADLAHRSAYGTLVRARKVRELGADPVIVGGLALYGRPFGLPTPRPRVDDGARYRVLVIHEYVWVPGAGHPGAPEDQRLRRAAREWEGFDFVVVGDNHTPFDRALRNGCEVFNLGGLMRRRVDERDHRPRVVTVTSAGVARSVRLPRHSERFRSAQEPPEAPPGEPGAPTEAAVAELVAAVRNTEPSALDFRDNVMRRLRATGARPGVRRIVVGALGG